MASVMRYRIVLATSIKAKHPDDAVDVVVLQFNPAAPSPWVTQTAYDRKTGTWAYGHYFDNYNSAFKDYLVRVKNDSRYQKYWQEKGYISR